MMHNKLNQMSREREDQLKNDTDVRMLSTVLNCFQAKSLDLLRKFSTIQMH